MKIQELAEMPRGKIYELVTKERITADSPIEKSSRSFPSGARAYLWTNESLCDLKNQLGVDLSGRNMLIVSASGDPFAVFSYLGANYQVGFDTSHRASLWSELKLRAIRSLDFNDFRKFTNLDKSNPEEEEYYSKLSPKLSKYAKSVFNELFKKHRTLGGIIQSGEFFRDSGCTGYFPQSNIYTENETNYKKAKKGLRGKKTVIVPGSLDDVIKLTDGQFSGFYGSNIIDHFKDASGHFNYSEGNIAPFLEKVNSQLSGDALIILQFEWSDPSTPIKILERLGYKSRMADGNSSGYGRLLVAERK